MTGESAKKFNEVLESLWGYIWALFSDDRSQYQVDLHNAPKLRLQDLGDETESVVSTPRWSLGFVGFLCLSLTPQPPPSSISLQIFHSIPNKE